MKAIAFDTETKGLDWFDDQTAFLATWADADGEYAADLSDPAQVRQFRQAIDEADVVIGHNLPFDTHQVRETLGFDPTEGKIIHDTDIMSRVLYPEGNRKGGPGHGLKPLAKVYLRVDAADDEDAIKEMGKAIGLKTMKQAGAYWEVYRAYPDVMTEYALSDARFTYDLREQFEPQLGDLKRIYDLEMAVMPILIRAEQRGIATDQAEVAKLKARFTAERQEVYEFLSKELGEAALGGEDSQDALAEALIKAGVPLYQKTETTGKLSTNKFALAEFEKDHPVIGALEEFRRLERFLTTYLGAIEGREVLHPSFRQCGAWTGRMSCTRPNMQNWPQRAGKEVRAVLVPRPGHAFVVCDYDQIETRLLAHYLGDQPFRDLIADGFDAHAFVASKIWPELGGYDYFVKGAPGETGEQSRKTARHTEFAIVYGAGAKRVTSMHPWMDPGPWYDEDHPAIVAARQMGRNWPKPGWQYHEGRALVSKIKAALPGYKGLAKRVREKIEALGYVNTMFGRKQVVGKDKAYVGINALLQGSAADIMKQGLVNVDAAVRPLGGTIVLVVHDEVVVEVPTENADEVLRLTEQALTAAADFSPGLAVSGSVVTTNYSDA